MVKEGARVDVKKRRIEQCVVDIFPQANPLTPCRIWERLSEGGLMKIKGVATARPLCDKGVHTPDSRFPMT